MLAGPETMLFLGVRHVMLQQVTARPARPALRAPPPRKQLENKRINSLDRPSQN